MCNHEEHPTRLIISGDKDKGEMHLELVGNRSELIALIIHAIMKDEDYAQVLKAAVESYERHKDLYKLFGKLAESLGGESIGHIPTNAPSSLVDNLSASLKGMLSGVKSRLKPTSKGEIESAINELFAGMKDEVTTKVTGGKKTSSKKLGDTPEKEKKPAKKKTKVPNNS